MFSRLDGNWIPLSHKLNLLKFCSGLVYYNFYGKQCGKNSDYKSSSKFCPTAGKSGQLEVFESFKDFVTGIDCKTFVLVSTLENNSPC